VAVGAPVFSNPQDVVQLSLSIDDQYRLVEMVPPLGFQVPFVYWLLVVSQVGGDYVVSAITHHGGNPAFHQHPLGSGNWWVGNRLDMHLPLTGGSGARMFVTAGVIVLGVGVAFGVVAGYVGVVLGGRRRRGEKIIN